jgi:hypothetical protein
MKRQLVWMACVLGLAGSAQANDSSFGGSGSALVPLREARVVMAWEEITLEHRHDPRVGALAWFVDARYELHNPTAEAITLQIGYPETRCHPDEDCNGQGGRFRDLETLVRGEKVTPRAGEVDPKITWAPPMGKVYLFDVTFAPGERVAITHRYTYDSSSSVEGQWVDYLTRTGALWGAPIGRARFTVRTPWRPLGITYPPEYKLQRYTERLDANQEPQTELVFELTQWTPTRDFAVYFPGEHNLGEGDCPRVWEVWATWQERKDDAATIAAHFASLDQAALALCRNWPYARHGYPFKKRALADHFYKKPFEFYGLPWYPGMGDGEERAPDRRWRFVGAQPNPDFTPALLTLPELRYVALIRQEEARRGPQRPPTPD